MDITGQKVVLKHRKCRPLGVKLPDFIFTIPRKIIFGRYSLFWEFIGRCAENAAALPEPRFWRPSSRGVRHCRKERTRFRIYRKISRFQQRFQISADSAKDFKISAKISDFSEDFKISAKISDFSEDFKISPKISRFHEDFCRDFKI